MSPFGTKREFGPERLKGRKLPHYRPQDVAHKGEANHLAKGTGVDIGRQDSQGFRPVMLPLAWVAAEVAV